jgi:hypothetical protein
MPDLKDGESTLMQGSGSKAVAKSPTTENT